MKKKKSPQGLRKKRFRIKKKKPFFKKKGFWLLLLFVLAMGGLFYFFVFSQIFQIKEIKISGNKKVSNETLREVVEAGIERKIVVPTKTIFLLNPNKIRKKILHDFPQIAIVELRRDFPDVLVLEIQERKALAVFCWDSENCFKVDKNGIIFDPVRESLDIDHPNDSNFSNGVEQGKEDVQLVVDFQGEGHSLGESLISEGHLNSILEIQNKFKQDLEIDVEKFSLSDKSLDILTASGFKVYFDLQGNISDQILNLELILKQEIPPEDWENLDYIDLRFGNRVFYK